ncbi:histone-binding protein MSI1-like [Bidens hawaiensis]|uniref:histone-binding protein MSI1-like n=1 Tax=Bidens hawaiensis TaxID=980011 RepID=UPI004048F5FB
MDSDSDSVNSEVDLDDEYKNWESSIPFMYDSLIRHSLNFPSMTVEWLPYRIQSSDRRYTFQKVILGTYAANGAPNYLIIAEVKIPSWDESGVGGKIDVVRRIPHDGEVYRARHMPQDPFIIATKTLSSEVYIFDYRHHPAEPPIGGTSKPDLRLTGHRSEGYGLSWSTINRGFLLSGSDDGRICLWDVNRAPLNKASIGALEMFKVPECSVGDVAWNLNHWNIFASGGNDGYLYIYDLRSPCFTSLLAHPSEINCLSFNPFNEWLVATGSEDNTVKCFDMRRLVRPLHTFNHHIGAVLQIGWSPHNESILASCCEARKVMIWDTERIGRVQIDEDVPPELVHTYGGHTDGVSDLSWNPAEEGMIASVADDFTLHVWKMADYIFSDY